MEIASLHLRGEMGEKGLLLSHGWCFYLLMFGVGAVQRSALERWPHKFSQQERNGCRFCAHIGPAKSSLLHRVVLIFEEGAQEGALHAKTFLHQRHLIHEIPRLYLSECAFPSGSKRKVVFCSAEDSSESPIL